MICVMEYIRIPPLNQIDPVVEAADKSPGQLQSQRKGKQI